jgi:signal transduction histidine kinase
MASSLTTLFAPVERAPIEVVREQGVQFSRLPMLAEFLDAVPDVVVILNSNRQVIFANQSLLNMIQSDWVQVEGKRPGEILDCVHATENNGGCGTTEFCQTCGAARAILSGLEGRHDVQECRIVRRSGDALDLRVTASPLEIKGAHYSIFAVQDISHEKRRKALERIFFHDILNVAGIVMGYAELLDNPRYSDETERIRDIIQRASVQLVDEIKSQRELLAAENGELVVRPVMLNSLKVLKNVKSFYDGHQVTQDNKVEIAPDVPSVSFTSDPLLLERVLGNMVKNALEASDSGQTVTLACGVEGNSVWFEVHNPAYMPRNVQLQIFQRSFSTKGDGRGLGTYSIKLLTEQYLGGRVSFASSPEAGTAFRVFYPMT